MIIRWEYKHCVNAQALLQDELNLLGLQGWDLVVFIPGSSSENYHYIFKRMLDAYEDVRVEEIGGDNIISMSASRGN